MSTRGRDQTKGARYIQQLDEARCHGNWVAVPDLLRKIKKHSSARTCLLLTAEAEYALSKHSTSALSHTRPGTAQTLTVKDSLSSDISAYIPRLIEAIEKEQTYVEDDFQAQACLGTIYWQLGEYQSAVKSLPGDIEQEFSQLDGTNKESAEWTKVCAIKAVYIKGSSQVKTEATSEALVTYESALPILASASQTQGQELDLWTELLLTGFCSLSRRSIKSKYTPINETETLSAFRAWASFWSSRHSAPSGGRVAQSEVSRRQVWKEYYLTLSDLLQQDLPFPATPLIITSATHSTRLQQRVELQNVEAKYEALLLHEVHFPKAEEVNEEMEEFVDIVMTNWRIVCGDNWKEQDLGEGGAVGVSRGVLDILYRAATKTFHSTPILRHLFTVHLSVAEFDLAFKAFDTYMEIVKRGKARVDKTGDIEPGLDNDETVLITASDCITALCRYGSYEAAEKAKDLGHYFQIWLEKHYPANAGTQSDDEPENNSSAIDIPQEVFATTWRSIAIGYANWARFTFDGSTRTEVQQQAITCFRNALNPKYNRSEDVSTLFALGTILAERREVAVAIEVVKSGLLPSRSTSPADVRSSAKLFTRERSLIPLWHLMALLLSAKQDFLTALKACEGAFEQFQDPKNLFGIADLNAPFRSEHLQVSENDSVKVLGVVDDMDDYEKENVLEVKMTQLTLIEIIEGPEVAVNASDELLSLYARLFGDPMRDSASPVHAIIEAPPKSSAGTLRSIKGSIFGRSGRPARKAQTAPARDRSTVVTRPQTSQTIAAPKIQVTNANGQRTTQHNHLTKQQPAEKQNRRSQSLSNNESRDRSSSTGQRHSRSKERSATTLDGEEYFTPLEEDKNKDYWQSGGESQRPVTQASQKVHGENTIAAKSSSSGHSSLTSPRTRFLKNQERRRRITTLIKVWLLVSGFYRRAAMYEDSRGAIEEATKLVSNLDDDVSIDVTGNISITESGWGGGKCVAELWADVFSERGYLADAESSPYKALAHFEVALTHFQDHPSAIVGLSNILLDIYNKDLLPPPSITPLALPVRNTIGTPSVSSLPSSNSPSISYISTPTPNAAYGPLGLSLPAASKPALLSSTIPAGSTEPNLKEPGTAEQDRIAARDRASFLLSSLTKLGKGWNYSEAWFALARAYELQGQLEKAKEVLWWCVELEDSRAVRDWAEVGRGGYVL